MLETRSELNLHQASEKRNESIRDLSSERFLESKQFFGHQHQCALTDEKEKKTKGKIYHYLWY